MYLHMCSLCLPPHHHQQWRRPSATSTKVGGREAVAPIVGDGEAANIAKTYAYKYQNCPHLHISHDSYYLPYVFPQLFSNLPTTTLL